MLIKPWHTNWASTAGHALLQRFGSGSRLLECMHPEVFMHWVPRRRPHCIALQQHSKAKRMHEGSAQEAVMNIAIEIGSGCCQALGSIH